MLLTIYLPISRINSIGIHKLNGWSNSAIFWALTKNGLLTIICTSLILDIASPLIFSYLPDKFLLTCGLVQCLIIILYLLANGFALLLIKKMTIADLLKNRYHFNFGVIATYLLKILMTITTGVFLYAISSNVNSLIKQYNTQREWQKEGNILILNSINSSTSSNVDATNKLMLSWYKKMNHNSGFYYIDGQIYKPSEILPENVNSNIINKKQIQVMTVNHNFLKANYPSLNRNTDFLIPQNLKGTKIKYLLQYLKYNELSSKEQKEVKPQNLKIKIDFYNQNISPITYNPRLDKVFNNPIIEVIGNNLTELQVEMLTNTDSSSPIKLENTSKNRTAIKSLSQQPKFRSLNLKFTTLNSLLATSTEDTSAGLRSLVTVLTFIVILNILTTIFLIFCIISEKQKELSVKRLLGYRRIDCYKYVFLFLLVLGIAELLTLIFLKSNIITIGIVLLLTVIDLLVLYLTAGYLENKNLSFLLKGGLS